MVCVKTAGVALMTMIEARGYGGVDIVVRRDRYDCSAVVVSMVVVSMVVVSMVMVSMVMVSM